MTFKYNNAYIEETATITGPYEENGPLSKGFDESYKDFYFGTSSWEQAEAKSIHKSINILLNKTKINKEKIDLIVSGDLLNQIGASNYAVNDLNIPYMGIYAACATSALGLITAANYIDNNIMQNILCTVSSHNNAAEKQFRYPVEYGGPKPNTFTFTATGAACALISNKGNIKIESGTIGTVIDSNIKDAFHMGAVMAPAAAHTINKHLKDLNRKIDYYDLVLTGDLGKYGKKILKDYMNEEYNINLNKYNDSGTLLYDLDRQPVSAGASGPACLPLVVYSTIIPKMKKGELKKVLLVATGALLNPSLVNQKLSIPAIAHAISLEVVK